MNLKSIPARGMLGVSRVWMDDKVLMAELETQLLGRALASEIESKHQYLADTLCLRAQMEERQVELNAGVAGASDAFDRVGRAFYGAFDVLAEATGQPEREAHYRKLQGFFFPLGLLIIQRTYLEKIGAIEELSRKVRPEVIEELAAIPIGDGSLADLYKEWGAAAGELRRFVYERTRMQESLRREGTQADDVDARAARNEWVRMVRTVLVAADTLNLSEAAREGLMGPLRRAADQAARNGNAEDGEVEGDGEIEGDITEGDEVGEVEGDEVGEVEGDVEGDDVSDVDDVAGEGEDDEAGAGQDADFEASESSQLTA